MQFIVKGMFTMVVEAGGCQEAKQTAERILQHEGVKAIALEVTENKRRGRKK
jgi:hypothetical protein